MNEEQSLLHQNQNVFATASESVVRCISASITDISATIIRWFGASSVLKSIRGNERNACSTCPPAPNSSVSSSRKRKRSSVDSTKSPVSVTSIGFTAPSDCAEQDQYIIALCGLLDVNAEVAHRVVDKYGDNLDETIAFYFGLSKKQRTTFESDDYKQMIICETNNTSSSSSSTDICDLTLPESFRACKCKVCFDKFSFHEGFRCVNGHFLCWEACFDGYVKNASEAGAIQGFCDTDGALLCPECKIPYELQQVAASGAPSRVFNALLQLKLQVQTSKDVKKAEEVLRIKLTAEFEATQASSNPDERAAQALRQQIIDDILTLRCPRVGCRQAFVDFGGCYALKCSSTTCRAGFCAWCLKDCGDDAHAHVLTCRERQEEGYGGGGSALFDAHHKARRKRLVEAKVRSRSKGVKIALSRLMKGEFEEFGIVLLK